MEYDKITIAEHTKAYGKSVITIRVIIPNQPLFGL